MTIHVPGVQRRSFPTHGHFAFFPKKTRKHPCFTIPALSAAVARERGMLLEAGAPRCIPRSQFPYFLKPPILRAGLREPPAASYSLPPAIIRFEPLAIFPALDVLHPRGILKIPAHRFPKPFLKTTARNPADLLFDLRGVNGVAQIMARLSATKVICFS